jgi:hypothetical protein
VRAEKLKGLFTAIATEEIPTVLPVEVLDTLEEFSEEDRVATPDPALAATLDRAFEDATALRDRSHLLVGAYQAIAGVLFGLAKQEKLTAEICRNFAKHAFKLGWIAVKGSRQVKDIAENFALGITSRPDREGHYTNEQLADCLKVALVIADDLLQHDSDRFLNDNGLALEMMNVATATLMRVGTFSAKQIGDALGVPFMAGYLSAKRPDLLQTYYVTVFKEATVSQVDLSRKWTCLTSGPRAIIWRRMKMPSILTALNHRLSSADMSENTKRLRSYPRSHR